MKIEIEIDEKDEIGRCLTLIAEMHGWPVDKTAHSILVFQIMSFGFFHADVPLPWRMYLGNGLLCELRQQTLEDRV